MAEVGFCRALQLAALYVAFGLGRSVPRSRDGPLGTTIQEPHPHPDTGALLVSHAFKEPKSGAEPRRSSAKQRTPARSLTDLGDGSAPWSRTSVWIEPALRDAPEESLGRRCGEKGVGRSRATRTAPRSGRISGVGRRVAATHFMTPSSESYCRTACTAPLRPLRALPARSVAASRNGTLAPSEACAAATGSSRRGDRCRGTRAPCF